MIDLMCGMSNASLTHPAPPHTSHLTPGSSGVHLNTFLDHCLNRHLPASLATWSPAHLTTSPQVLLKLLPRIDYGRSRGALRSNMADDLKRKKLKRPPAKVGTCTCT